MSLRNWWVSVAAAGAILSVTACGGQPTAPTDAGADQSSSAAQEQGPDAGAGQADPSQPDTEGIPEVVAEVNGTAIEKDEFVSLYENQFQQLAAQAQASGQRIDQDQLKQQTLDSLVDAELLTQEASDRDFRASEDEIEQALAEMAAASQLDRDEFLAAMEERGMEEADVLSQVETQLAVDQLVAAEFGDFEVTEEDLETAYEQVKAQQEQMGPQSGQTGGVPALEEVRPQLEEQVRNQKKSDATRELADKLRQAADVVVNL